MTVVVAVWLSRQPILAPSFFVRFVCGRIVAPERAAKNALGPIVSA